MNTLVTTDQNIVVKEGGNIAVTALLPQDMNGCQQALIAWAERKIAELQAEAAELLAQMSHGERVDLLNTLCADEFLPIDQIRRITNSPGYDDAPVRDSLSPAPERTAPAAENGL